MKVIQVVPTVAFGDAIGNETRALKEMFKNAGYKTELYYSDGMDSRLPRKTARHISKLKVKSNDVLIYHLATGTDLNYKIEQYNCKKIIRYHNITPPAFFKGYNEVSQRICEEGYRGARYLADKVDYFFAVSKYNQEDLKKMGYECDGTVIPILIAFDDYSKKPNQTIISKYGNDGYINFLFTGRIVPNKKIEDVIQAFYCFHKYINQKSRLILVGNYSGMERYYNKLSKYVEQLELKDSVVFTGHIKFDEILAYYSIAHAFVCMSEHEGFCVPLVEAMLFNIPIIAYDSSAIGDTLGNSGILLKDKNPRLVAEWMQRVVVDTELRKTIVENERERLQYFSHEHVEKMFLDSLKEFIDKGKG